MPVLTSSSLEVASTRLSVCFVEVASRRIRCVEWEGRNVFLVWELSLEELGQALVDCNCAMFDQLLER